MLDTSSEFDPLDMALKTCHRITANLIWEN